MKNTIIILISLFFQTLVAQDSLSTLLRLPASSTLQQSSLVHYKLDSLYIHNQVDSIITNGIKNQSFPGAQVLVAKNGNIIFHKTYGHHTYDSVQPVQVDDLYDLASVTKILGPLPAIMKLVDDGKLNLDQPFSNYWKPWKRRKDKRHITLREILAHQAGLQPYIVFLNTTLKNNGKFKKRFLRNSPKIKFQNKAYEHIYVRNNFNRKMYRMINRSKVSEEKIYTYSGLAFLLFPELIEQLTGKSYNDYLQTEFYGPLGMHTFGFLPKNKNFSNNIVPTEIDTLYRHTLTKGWVHDENASLLGGISGNAGLFGTADDLAIIMQLFLQKGIYAGKRYISENTVNEFIKVQYPENGNRRGLGFDKPYLNNEDFTLQNAYPAPEVGQGSFGHSGFTGTFVWADPEHELIYIFLSNRVYPTRENRNIYDLNIRPAVQQVFYKAFDNVLQRTP
ncbi:CubicO group peptidase, beta-lactamase class C family [Maribacter sedimenticola]|uniref:CubicO group peptidase, beta-lactamase class C family n=1 Tax=Maribacter sedimenticola TaxID=228956 RepID=A0ABY1SD42_9FLAO|nr:serine hydrolase domain-containing protein [Maribacter sedimenticola]SNR25609.1 CubicO group peptidase, beta-lactamase class C family [Maribacter sedimenticola]